MTHDAMTHDQARESIAAEPENTSAELQAHLQSCPECQTYREQMLILNARLRRALELNWPKVQRPALLTASSNKPSAAHESVQAPAAPPPPRASAEASSNVTPLRREPPEPVPKLRRPRLFAVAASLAAALLVGFTLWLSRPQQTLAGEIVLHVEGEPNSWNSTEPVAAERLSAVLSKSRVELGTGTPPIVYANSCWFRGHFVPHFVLMTRDGPVTVMILVHERVSTTQRFSEAGYSGLLVPAPAGSIAVLSRTPMALEQPASEVVRALQSAGRG